MTKDKLIKIADSLGIEHYNECDEFICLKGINGGASVMHTDTGAKGFKYLTVAVMSDFAAHLKQMGRDGLKMELNTLLDITRHA